MKGKPNCNMETSLVKLERVIAKEEEKNPLAQNMNPQCIFVYEKVLRIISKEQGTFENLFTYDDALYTNKSDFADVHASLDGRTLTNFNIVISLLEL